MGKYTYKKVNPENTAKHFLVEALKYYNNGDDLSYLVAALTLAGISEELIEKMLKSEGRETAFEVEKKGFVVVAKILNMKEKSNKEIHKFIYKAKNTTKHEPNEHYLDPKAEAQNILMRAIRNFERYFGIMIDEMRDLVEDRDKDIERLIKRVSSFRQQKSNRN